MLPINQIKAHQDLIRSRQHDGRLRLVFFLEANSERVDPKAVIVCARSEGCLICQSVLDEFREAGIRIVDVGVLSSPVKVEGVGRGESSTPPAPI